MLHFDGNDSPTRLRQKLNKNTLALEKMDICTGFVSGEHDDNDSVIVTYNSTTRRVTLTGNVEAYHDGNLVPQLVSGWVSDAHAATTGLTYYLRYTGTGFVFDSNPWNSESDLTIASVQYGATYKMCVREVHGIVMDKGTRQYLHDQYGTARKPNGAIFSGYYLDSTTAADRRPTLSGIKLMDEDLMTTIASMSTGAYCHRYLSGSAVRTFTTAQADIIALNGNQPYYNLNTGGTWSQALFPNNDYGAIFVVAAPVSADSGSQAYRLMFVQPQQTSGDLKVIQALTPSDLNHGSSDSLLPEFNFIGKIIIRYTGGNWTITSVEELLGSKNNQLAVVSVDSRIDDMTFRFISTAAADTADKGTFNGYIPNDTLLDIIFSNGNTAASPTITIGTVTYNLVSFPTVAKLSTSSYQCYKARKTAEDTITCISYPDYDCEYGNSSGWEYHKYISGKSECYIYNVSLTMAASSTFGSFYRYISNGTNGVGATMPAIFNTLPLVFATMQSSSTTKMAPHGFATGSGPYVAHLQYISTASNASTSSQTISFHAIGTWK